MNATCGSRDTYAKRRGSDFRERERERDLEARRFKVG